MQTFAPRAARRALARTVVIVAAIGALGACADETTAPARNAPSRAVATSAAPSPEASTTSANLDIDGALTFYPSAGALVGVALTCSTNQTVDLLVGLEQEQKQGGTKTLVQGLGVLLGVPCTPATSHSLVTIGNAVFQPGRATLHALVQNSQTGVKLEVTRRVRLDG